MKEVMTCTLYYNRKTTTHHLWQVFTGFYELQAKGFIKVKVEERDWLPESYTENLLLVDIDNECKVIYDVNDGINWLWGDMEANLQYFRDTLSLHADFYFKRSYNDILLQYSNKSKTFPLGLNYGVTSPENKMFSVHFDLKSRIKHRIQTTEWLRKILKVEGRAPYYMKNFEYIPFSQNRIPKILFLARLWDPGTVAVDKLKDTSEVEENRQFMLYMNEVRIKSITECRKIYGKQFTGGLTADKYTAKNYPELAVPYEVSDKQNYLDNVKASDICIATMGLNKSIGWKMAEYVAAARGIISEKMYFQLPGNFSAPHNFLEFVTVDQLLGHIDTLVRNPGMLREMMIQNYRYYNLYVRPDNLILNSLLIIKEQTGSAN